MKVVLTLECLCMNGKTAYAQRIMSLREVKDAKSNILEHELSLLEKEIDRLVEVKEKP